MYTFPCRTCDIFNITDRPITSNLLLFSSKNACTVLFNIPIELFSFSFSSSKTEPLYLIIYIHIENLFHVYFMRPLFNSFLTYYAPCIYANFANSCQQYCLWKTSQKKGDRTMVLIPTFKAGFASFEWTSCRKKTFVFFSRLFCIKISVYFPSSDGVSAIVPEIKQQGPSKPLATFPWPYLKLWKRWWKLLLLE